MKIYGAISAVFIIALFFRLMAVTIAAHNNAIETWEYEEIATNILNGAGYQMNHFGTTHYTFCPPAYPFFSAFVYFLTGHSKVILAAVQAIVSAFGCIFIFLLGKTIFNNKVALLSSVMAALHPGIILYVAKLHSFNIDWVLFAVLIFALLKALSKMSLGYFIFFGFVFGVCFLARSTVLLFMPLVLIVLSFSRKGGRNKLAQYFIVSFIAASVIITPWAVRNYMRLGQIELVQKSGVVFWRGNNINATGTSYTTDGMPIIEASSPQFLKKLYSSNEIDQDALFWKAGLEFIKTHPFKFLVLYLKKFYYFWWFSPNYGMHYAHLHAVLYKFLYAILLIAAIIGIYAALRSQNLKTREYTLIFILFFLTVSLSQSLFYVEGRHRLAIEPLFIIFSAFGLIKLKESVGA